MTYLSTTYLTTIGLSHILTGKMITKRKKHIYIYTYIHAQTKMQPEFNLLAMHSILGISHI